MSENKLVGGNALNGFSRRDPGVLAGALLLGAAASINTGCATTHASLPGRSLEKYPECREQQKNIDLDRCSLEDLPRSLRDDSDLVKDIVAISGEQLVFASKRLRNDPEIVLAAIQDSAAAFSFAAKELQQDRAFVIRALEVNAGVFRWLDANLQDDPELLMVALAKNGLILEFASITLKDDQDMVLRAVSENGSALRYASSRLTGVPEIVLRAAHSFMPALTYASKELLSDRSFALTLLRKERWGLEHFDVSVRNDPTVVFEAIRISPSLIQFAGREFIEDRERMFQAAKIRGAILQYVSDKLREDEAFAFQAVLNEGFAVKYLPEKFLNDTKFLQRLVRINYSSYRFLVPLLDHVDGTVEEAALAMQQALRTLGITHPERFDNTQEILRLRYAVSSPEIQEALENLLGAEYFAEETSDDRPLAVIIYPDNDDGRGFFELNAFGDNIDRLTRAYRVVYYDVASDLEMALSLAEATSARGQAASLLMLGGHGAQTTTSFGYGSKEAARLDLKDLAKLQHLTLCLQKGAKIILASCSTGAGSFEEAGVQNIAELLSLIWPDCFVFAPRSDTMVDMQLDNQGRFLAPGYQKSETLIISPQSP